MKMRMDNREEIIELLDSAENCGIIYALDDESLRKIKFVTNEGVDAHIEWYKNLGTLHFAGFSMWFDEIFISRTHPSYSCELSFSYLGVKSAFIGIKHNHLKYSGDSK